MAPRHEEEQEPHDLHPDAFGGSDEDSHLTSSRQGLKGLDYGMSAAESKRIIERAKKETGVTDEEAQSLHDRFLERYPALSKHLSARTEEINRALSQLGIHALKTWPDYFQAVVDGRKTFELRKNDRDYHPEDILVLREWDPETEKYSGRELEVRVTYMTDAPQLKALSEGWVVMAIRKCEHE